MLIASGRSSDFRIILLAAPSHLPMADSDMLRFSSPVTAAGPSPILTEFPFMLNIEHLIEMFLTGIVFYCKVNCVIIIILGTSVTQYW